METEPYDLRRGSYKTLRLRLLSEGTLRVTAPWFLPRFVIDRFVADRREWISQRRLDLRAPQPDVLHVWGECYQLIVLHPGKIPRLSIDLVGKTVTLRVPEGWTETQQRRVLEKDEKERVAEALSRLIPDWSARTGLKVERWAVKRLRSRGNAPRIRL